LFDNSLDYKIETLIEYRKNLLKSLDILQEKEENGSFTFDEELQMMLIVQNLNSINEILMIKTSSKELLTKIQAIT